MITVYELTRADGAVQVVTTITEARAAVHDDPTITVRPVVKYRPCPSHRAYEDGYCPSCGTSAVID